MASRSSDVFLSRTPSHLISSHLSTERLNKKLANIDARRGCAEIRKLNKDEQMKKKRQIAVANELTVSSSTTEELETRIAEPMQVLKRFFSDQGTVLVEPDLLRAVKDLRRLLSVERNPPVDLVIDAGALPYLVAFLTNDDYPRLQFEAAWALTNIASTSRSKDVANCENAVPSLVKLLYSPSGNVREQAIWCIGNIAGESVSFRDGILREPGLIEGM
jgi:importin subunit alpha-1